MTNKKGWTHDSIDNKTIEWYTPKYIFDMINVHFDLDPCHPVHNASWIPVTNTYNIHDDGLSKEWIGNVWCNPPYGKYTKTWLEKMHNHRNGIALVFARTDCKWYHDYCKTADAILFLKSRIKFVDGSGKSKGSGAGSGSMLIAWGDHNVKSLELIKEFGHFIDMR